MLYNTSIGLYGPEREEGKAQSWLKQAQVFVEGLQCLF
jgi:hypothetical protein